jgi:hypothetical protein
MEDSNTLGLYIFDKMSEGRQGWCKNTCHNYCVTFNVTIWVYKQYLPNQMLAKIYNLHMIMHGRHAIMNLNQIWNPITVQHFILLDMHTLIIHEICLCVFMSTMGPDTTEYNMVGLNT